jgi:hypothetical protein
MSINDTAGNSVDGSKIWGIGILKEDSLHFMKRYLHHEITKVGKHEKFISFISCLRLPS